jgi:hypothetical protein
VGLPGDRTTEGTLERRVRSEAMSFPGLGATHLIACRRRATRAAAHHCIRHAFTHGKPAGRYSRAPADMRKFTTAICFP